MVYTIRCKDGDVWLDLLDERGEMEQFDRFPDAVVRGKELLQKGQAREVKVNDMVRLWLGSDGLVYSEWL